jgi:hypothetical protein
MRSLPKLSVAILKDTISSTTTLAVSLMGYAKVYPIPISTKRGPTIIKTWTPLFMDVVVEMIQLVTTSWAEDIIQGGKEDTPTPMATGMVMSTEDIIKIKDSRDLCFLLSHLDTVVVVVGEVIMEKDDTIIIIMVLHSLLDHQGIEAPHLHLLGHLDITVLHLQDHPVSIIVHHHLQGHLDIMVPHHHHPQCLMDHVDIIGIMDHPLLDLDIIGLLLLLLLDVVISHFRLHHLDVVMGVDLHIHLRLVLDLLLAMDQDNTDHLLSLQDQDIMDLHPPMDIEIIEDPGPGVLVEEVIEVLLSLDISAVLVHPLPLRDADARSVIPPSMVMDLSPFDIKSMTM